MVVALIGIFLFHVRQQADAERAHMMALQREAKQYETELAQLREEYEKLMFPSVDRDISMVLIGFLTSGDSAELERIPLDTDYTPIIASEKNVLTSDMAERCELVAAGDQKISDYRLLRLPADTEEKRSALKADGYTVCIRYKDACTPSIDGTMTYLNYGMIRSADADVRSLLAWLVEAKQSFLLIFDLSAVPDSIVSQDLALVQEQVAAGNLVYGSIASATAAVEDYEARKEAAQKEAEARKTSCKAQMDAVQAKIDDIYSHWNEVK